MVSLSDADVSECDTLLEPDLSRSSSADDNDINSTHPRRDPDRPVQLVAFRRNVSRCKITLGMALVLSSAAGVGHLVHLPRPHGSLLDRDPLVMLDSTRWSCDILCTGLTVTALLLFILSILRPLFPNRASISTRPYELHNLGLHRLFCTSLFVNSILCTILHLVPGVVYTLLTKLGPPTISPTTQLASRVHTLSLLLGLIAVGCMRRGPRMRAEERSLGTGFGIRSEQDLLEERLGPLKANKGKGKGQGKGSGSRRANGNGKSHSQSNVIDYANCSMLTFISLGYTLSLARRSLEVDQLVQPDLPLLEEWARKNGDEFLSDLGPKGVQFKPYTSSGLVRTLWGGRGRVIFITFCLETLCTIIGFVQVSALHEIVDSFGDGEDKSYAYLMCWGLFLGQSVEVLLSAYLWVRENYLLHNPVRMTLSAMLFAKILRSTDAKAMEAQHLNSTEDESANRGRSQVMNLMTIDAKIISSMATYIWSITNGLISLFIGLFFLYSMLGVSALVGLACIPLFTPLSVWIAKKSYECDKAWARARDARTGAIKEFLMGIKVIKLNAFEEHEIRRIGRLRDRETIWQIWRYRLGTIFNLVTDQVPTIGVVITFIVYTKVCGHVLTPATAFVTITVFFRVRSGLDTLPQAVEIVLTTKVSLDRLKRYLNQPEVFVSEKDVSDSKLAFENDAAVSWPRAEEDNDSGVPSTNLFQLSGLNISLPVGRMTLVCGPLGAGKTLFIRALLGEAKVDNGRVIAPRSLPDTTPLDSSMIKFRWTNDLWLENSVAYAPQMSYIRHGSVKDNILFGQPMWQERYEEVLRQCSLLPDLQLLVDGDETEVGDHGVNLSGGQRARINLARCIYSRARTVYLDDVLSAVDAHTAQFLVTECFQGELVKNRTFVLVSHHVDLCLAAVDFVVALDNGRVDHACPAEETKLATLIALASPVDEKRTRPESPFTSTSPGLPGSSSDAPGVGEVLSTLVELSSPKHDKNAEAITQGESDIAGESGVGDFDLEVDANVHASKVTRIFYRTEHQETGRVQTSHYWMMITAAGGIGYWTVFAAIYLMTKLLDVVMQRLVESWTEDTPDRLDYYINLYILINIAQVLVSSMRWVWLYGIGRVGWYTAGTKKIHVRLFQRICNAPLSFFETTPSGRILNIFGQDQLRLDSQSADDFGRTVMQMNRVVAAALVVGYEAPSMLFVLVAFGVPLYLVAGGLSKLRTDLRRLSAIADSPLISLYHDSIDGVVMLRAFGMPNVMAQTMTAVLNRSRVGQTWNWVVYNWIRSIVLTLSSIFVTATGVLLIGRDISPAKAGFILSFASQISSDMFSLLERFILLELTFVSAERINHYIQTTEQEPQDGLVPAPEWPPQGGIVFRNLKMRYADDLPDVLHDVSFAIEPGMRVGLVGATGSGKSTLALSLFRAVEAYAGSIEIDGVDIAHVKLQELRKRLNMVVQDGSLMSGTLRDALDISGVRDDYEIYDALKRVHLLPQDVAPENVIGNPFADLDSFVAMEGSNFSHGQRQLLCLARALLKHSKILVMDEATSSVDFEMDAKITATIKDCFAETTMLVIAHRLATIIHFDRVLVLDKGQVVEYERPLKLMQTPGSAFHALCMAQGREEFDRLLAMAQGSVQ